MQQKKTTAIHATSTSKRVRSIVKNMNDRALSAKQNGLLTAYCMTGCQYDEILVAFDIVPIWTENWAGLCAAKREAGRFLQKAESQGYADVICGYTRVGLGFDGLRCELGHAPENSPDGGMAEPDMMLGSSCSCDPRYKWYQALGRYKKTPLFNVDVMWIPVEADTKEVLPSYVKYQTKQLKELIEFLERLTGRKMDYDKYEESFAQSQKTWQLWYEVDQLRKAVPSPMPSQDHFNVMVPGMFLCGYPEATQFYQDLRDEVQERVNNKVGVLETENYRLLWGGGLPPWHTMWVFNYFEDLGGVFAIENGYRAFDPVEIPSSIKDPIEKLAYRSVIRFSEGNDVARKHTGNATVEKILRQIDEYKIDGVFMHASRSCRAMTVGQIHVKNLISRYSKVPVLLLTSDIIDMRDYSEAHWRAQVEGFMAAVETYKKGNQKSQQSSIMG
ncbi:MAG: 2-hydroxyacyl-CoA dehydratase family protein [Dehalococcoidia bacterium]|nr:2-hydroxyacyl-CoA dehydratase family protein [Dehalococcoidia bacterium]